MTTNGKKKTTQDEAQADKTIEHVFEFVRDIIEDPTALDNLPDKAQLVLTPLEQTDTDTAYAVTTQRFAVSFQDTTQRHHRSERHKKSTGGHKRRSA